jgi:hypothetical protein
MNRLWERAAPTRFIVVTADLQVIRPMVQLRRTAVLPGVRMVVNF